MAAVTMKIEDYDDAAYENLMIPTPIGDFYTVPYRGLLVVDVRKDRLRFKDTNDVLQFQVNGDPRKESQTQKLIQNGAGDPVVFLLKKAKSLHYKWLAYGGDRENQEKYVFSMKIPSGLPKHEKFHVFLPGNVDKKSPDFVISGDFKSHQYLIKNADVPVAQVTSKLESDRVRLEKNDFAVKLCPGADHAFIVAIVTVIEQRNVDGFLAKLKMKKDEPEK
ncbi:hypothetical protein R1sor_008665 [Riccia sorocarpa]|uniref:Uncharacterized protein n=1 Tax=Riccia sorocarpa TaxID=122646 RepID=A0ABD3I0A6_9MARC